MNQHLSKQMLWALLFGNLAVGMGIMVVPATLTNISDNLGHRFRSLASSLPLARS